MRSKAEIREEVAKELGGDGKVDASAVANFDREVDRRLHWERVVEEIEAFRKRFGCRMQIELADSPCDGACGECRQMNGRLLTLERMKSMKHPGRYKCSIVSGDGPRSDNPPPALPNCSEREGTAADRDESKQPNGCQLKVVHNATGRLSPRDRTRNLVLRLLSAIERRIERARRALGQIRSQMPTLNDDLRGNGAQPIARSSARSGKGKLRPGDVVEVRPLDEIAATLDETEACEGLSFMDGMQEYCGRRLVVKKRVRAMFDEPTKRMVKIRNTYILEGVICDGIRQCGQEGCDRCCFFFWKDKWLRKLQ